MHGQYFCFVTTYTYNYSARWSRLTYWIGLLTVCMSVCLSVTHTTLFTRIYMHDQVQQTRNCLTRGKHRTRPAHVSSRTYKERMPRCSLDTLGLGLVKELVLEAPQGLLKDKVLVLKKVLNTALAEYTCGNTVAAELRVCDLSQS